MPAQPLSPAARSCGLTLPAPTSLDANGLSSPGGHGWLRGFALGQEGYNAASGGAEAQGGTAAGSIACGLLFGKSGTAQWEATNPQMTEVCERRIYPNP